MKILESLGDNKYVIELKDNCRAQARETRIGLVHDYIAFDGTIWFQHPNGSVYRDVRQQVSIHVPIRSFIQVMMPLIEASPYTKLEHIADRAYTEDDKYNGDTPKYKKGDKYAGYSYENQVVHYYDKDNSQAMVAILKKNDRVFSHVTLQFYNEFVKDNLKY